MKTKEMFNSLRVTTMEVAAPLINLAAHRGKMVRTLIDYIQKIGDVNDTELQELILTYNEYALRDKELVEIAQGKASDELP